MKVGSLLGAFLSTLSSLAPSSSLDVAFSLKINPFLWVPLYVLKERRIKKPPGSRQQQAIRLILFRFQSGFLSFSFWLCLWLLRVVVIVDDDEGIDKNFPMWLICLVIDEFLLRRGWFGHCLAVKDKESK